MYAAIEECQKKLVAAIEQEKVRITEDHKKLQDVLLRKEKAFEDAVMKKEIAMQESLKAKEKELDDRFNKMKRAFEDNMKMEKEAMAKDRAAFDAMMKKREEEFQNNLRKKKEEEELMLRKIAQSQEKITLDVGGTVFATTKSTLLADQNSYFSNLLLQNPSSVSFFIDRDPTVFKHIVNFLRGIQPPLELMAPYEIDLLRKDVEFYQLQALKAQLGAARLNSNGSGENGANAPLQSSSSSKLPLSLQQKPLPQAPQVPLSASEQILIRWKPFVTYDVSSDGRTITSKATGVWDGTCLSEPPFTAVGLYFEWTLKIVQSNNFNIMIGCCPANAQQQQPNTYTNPSSSFYYCSNGTLHPQNRAYGTRTKIGSLIKVFLDLEGQTVRYSVDDDVFPVVSTPLAVPSCACVLFRDPGDVVSLVSFKAVPKK